MSDPEPRQMKQHPTTLRPSRDNLSFIQYAMESNLNWHHARAVVQTGQDSKGEFSATEVMASFKPPAFRVPRKIQSSLS